jgi:SAM-dependent methyltransferase
VSDWTHGYVADIDYTYGYYGELNPLRTALPFLNTGLAPPKIESACELGFGQGVSVNVHAAASNVLWYGTDFNPSQASFAQSMAAAAGADTKLFDLSFADFCVRSDLPDFDYIGLHGIWSWVSDENRRIIVDFIRRKLKVGGVLYVSYNTQPGWAAMVPLRHLLTEHAEVMAAPGRGLIARIDAALDFAEKLWALNPRFARAHANLIEFLRQMKGQNRHYLAHEYFNRDWRPVPFAEMAEWLEPAKVSYACTAGYLDHIDGLNLTAEQQQFLSEIPDPMFRQSVRDFMVNQQFRRDYWVKGPSHLSALRQGEILRRERVILVTPADEFVAKVTGALGEADISGNRAKPVIDLLADYRPRSIGEIETALAGEGLTIAQIYEMVMILAGKGDIAPVQGDEAQAAAKRSAERLNRFLMDRARGGGELPLLASPVSGGGFPVTRFHLLFLLARLHGEKTPEAWADSAWQTLSSYGQRLMKNNKPLETPEENRAELVAQATEFAEKRLPVLQALQVA